MTELEKAQARIKDLEKQVSDQNSYITKLENKAKQGDGMTPEVKKFVFNQMAEKMKSKVVKKIKEEVDPKYFDAVEPDFEAFLEKHLREDTLNEAYIIDAFNLVWGRAMRKKDHPIHQVDKADTPDGTSADNKGGSNAGNPNPKKTEGQGNPSQQTPPTISPEDSGAGGSGAPDSEPVPIKSTKESFNALKEKVKEFGGGRFS